MRLLLLALLSDLAALAPLGGLVAFAIQWARRPDIRLAVRVMRQRGQARYVFTVVNGERTTITEDITLTLSSFSGRPSLCTLTVFHGPDRIDTPLPTAPCTSHSQALHTMRPNDSQMVVLTTNGREGDVRYSLTVGTAKAPMSLSGVASHHKFHQPRLSLGTWAALVVLALLAYLAPFFSREVWFTSIAKATNVEFGGFVLGPLRPDSWSFLDLGFLALIVLFGATMLVLSRQTEPRPVFGYVDWDEPRPDA